MFDPYDPPPEKPQAKQRWLTPRFVMEFVVGGVIGFFVLCLIVVIFLWGITV